MAGEVSKTTVFEYQYEVRKGDRNGGDTHRQTDIDEQITAAPGDEPSRCRREQDRYLNK